MIKHLAKLQANLDSLLFGSSLRSNLPFAKARHFHTTVIKNVAGLEPESYVLEVDPMATWPRLHGLSTAILRTLHISATSVREDSNTWPKSFGLRFQLGIKVSLSRQKKRGVGCRVLKRHLFVRTAQGDSPPILRQL
jgi:hypothetical protein